jgi:hypothetical protein
MSLNWTFAHFHHGHYPAVAADILNQLNGLDKEEAAFAKVASADQHGGEARGVVFWTAEAPTEVPDLPDGSQWKSETYQTSNDYEQIFGQVRDKLNTLNDAQAFFSKVDFTNAQNNPAFMTIYWLE